MKYCSRCGAQLFDEAVICIKCGCAVAPAGIPGQEKTLKKSSSGMRTAAFVLMIIKLSIFTFYSLLCLISGIALGEIDYLIAGLILLVPFSWQLPMLIYCGMKRKSGEAIGVGFKVCTLIFFNLIAGILLLCEEN